MTIGDTDFVDDMVACFHINVIGEHINVLVKTEVLKNDALVDQFNAHLTELRTDLYRRHGIGITNV